MFQHRGASLTGSGIGSLNAIGFTERPDDILVVLHQGRGLFNCLAGERLSRDQVEFFQNSDDSGMTTPEIGRQDNTVFRMAGLHDGGLATATRDGWRIHITHLSWPVYTFFLNSSYKERNDDTGHITKPGKDELCSFRATGFSPTGGTFVIATSCDLTIYGRDVT